MNKILPTLGNEKEQWEIKFYKKLLGELIFLWVTKNLKTNWESAQKVTLHHCNLVKICDKKWIKLNDLSSSQYSVNKTLRFKTSMLRSDLWDYSDLHIVVKERITIEGENDAKTRNKKIIFKNKAPFQPCISKINNTFINNAENLDIVMPMYNLLESRSLYNYIYEVNDENKNNNANNGINNNKLTSKSFEYKTITTGQTPTDTNTLKTEIVNPLKYLKLICHSQKLV